MNLLVDKFLLTTQLKLLGAKKKKKKKKRKRTKRTKRKKKEKKNKKEGVGGWAAGQLTDSKEKLTN